MPLFNLDTMSGVTPGTRTQVFQRLQLDAVDGGRQTWARLLWFTEPASCSLHLQAAEGEQGASEPVLQLAEPLSDGRFDGRLHAAAAAAGWQVRCCGSCQHWRNAAATNPNGLPTGHCTWLGAGGGLMAEPDLALQSSLALSCGQWQAVDRTVSGVLPVAAPQASTQATTGETQLRPLTKAAEVKRPGLLGRVRRLLGRDQAAQPANDPLSTRVVERSGVGAGTEPCFACQGRLANLGALAVQTAEGDKQTFSIWRCRSCYTYYLNDWVDRWERLDSLETEETYYRVAPAQAFELLAIVDSVAGGDHPAGRQARTQQREHFLAFERQHTALSHQIRQGR